uniref:ribonuclease H n=1 Tax=Cyprinus carpio carpio TaxID=630221 RepID=A0A9J8CJW6_CYPCA
MGKSQSKLVKYDTPVFCQMRKLYGQKCMQDIGKLIKYHDFPKEGTLSVTRLNVVKESVEEGSKTQKGCCVKHMCGKCEETVNCWIEEADKRERRAMQKKLADRNEKGRKNEKCEEKVTAAQKLTNPSDVCSLAPPPYPHYPAAELQALKVDPDLDCSPPKRPTAPRAEADEDPNIIPETPNEEAEEEGVHRIPPSKKIKTRQTVKEENVSITASMIDGSGPDGPMMVFRPWTVNDMKEAMAHLPSPDEAGDKCSAELVTFCQEFSPTMHELRRLLAVKLGASSWHKVSGKLQREDCRREHSDWEHRANAEYRKAVTELAGAIKIAFPARVDTAKIGNCCQTREEPVQDYYHRLYQIFIKHSGLTEPDNRKNQPDTWECHLRSWFLNGLRPEIAQAVKSSYIEWKNGRLTAILAHALHAEEQQAAKKEKTKAKSDRELQLSLVQALSRPGGSSVPPPQRRGRGGKYSNRAEGHSEKRGCWVCGTEDHVTRKCTKCKLCKKDGHWARECPENQKTREEDGEQEGGVLGEQPTATMPGSERLTTRIHTYTDVHTALCSEEKACISLCASDLNNDVFDKCLMMYKSKGFLNMPRYPMQVEGIIVQFLVDSGATRSSLRPCDLPCQPSLTNKTNESISVSGHQISERFTVPLNCETEVGRVLKHAFIYSPACPAPLMGRDLMSKLNLTLVADSTGVRVTEEEQLCCLQAEPQWAYEWRIVNNDWAQMMCVLTKNQTKTFNAEITLADSLHCTSHVVMERDQKYENDWFNVEKGETLSFDQMFWTENVCAVSVRLTEKQLPFYLIAGESVPHLSVSKARDQFWSEVGLFVKKCVETTDWCEMSAGVKYSEGLGAFMSECRHEFEVERVVTPTDKSAKKNHCMANICASDIHPALAEVPSELWAKHKYDVGLIKGCEPVVITPKSDYRPCQQQYPLKAEAMLGIKPVFESLLKEGIIVPCNDSPVRTPIFPVKKIRDKDQPTEWRFVQDLRAVNAAVRQRAPSVPNPYTILSQIPQDATFFSVVDLANACFSVPMDKNSEFWFAFNFNGKSYTFTRLCQGYCESPTIYSEALRRSLEPLTLTAGTALLQYVDDLLICARDEPTCVADTVSLLKHLAQEGHKVSLSKLQFVKQQVTFLGYVITPNSKSLSDKRVQAIKDVPKPVTKKQMLSFLGMCSYCRTFIPNYAILEQPLRALTLGKGLKSCDKIEWTGEAEEAFVNVKVQLSLAPTLGLPVPAKPFVQMVDEKNGFMTSVLLQLHGDRLRPVAYFSSKLDPVAAGLPPCLRAVAAAEQAVMASRQFVGYSDLTLMVPHAVSMILQEQKTLHLSATRWLRYRTILLDMPNITVKRCTTLNPATLLPMEEDGEEHHCCMTVLKQVCTPRPDLSDIPRKL